MKFSVIASAALAGTALAAPLTEARRARHEARRKSQRPQRLGDADSHNITEVQYSNNWAGAVLVGSGYTAVTGDFVVPVPGIPPGGSESTQYCGAAWVGLDGDTCSSAILQTGVDFCVQGGSVTYSAWYEWYPDYMYTFSGITISTGDTIRMSVDASSLTAGTATIENLSNGQTVNHSWDGNVQGDLCETNAEWIVEDFESGSSLVPFATFGTVTISNAIATQNGESVGPAGAQIMDIQQNGQTLTSSSVSGDSVIVTSLEGGSTPPPPSSPSTPPTSPSTPPTTGGQVPQWGQCGGIGYTGPTTCESPYTCVEESAYWSSCQ